MATLDDAIALAVMAHSGHLYPTDEIGSDPFILHPLRVMLSVALPEERIVAVLHDVIEESDTTLDDLRALGLAESVTAAVDLLTHREADSYEAYIDALADSPLARAVKVADLRDNLAHGRGFPGAEEIAVRHRAALYRLGH
jgi:(p)ppGpp synthase/HD superfamily hydrolase